MDCSLPGSSTHGIFQARVLEWVAVAFSESKVETKHIPRFSVWGPDHSVPPLLPPRPGIQGWARGLCVEASPLCSLLTSHFALSSLWMKPWSNSSLGLPTSCQLAPQYFPCDKGFSSVSTNFRIEPLEIHSLPTFPWGFISVSYLLIWRIISTTSQCIGFFGIIFKPDSLYQQPNPCPVPY